MKKTYEVKGMHCAHQFPRGRAVIIGREVLYLFLE